MIIGLYIMIIFTIGFIRKVDLYQSFTLGIKKGLNDVYNLVSPIISLQILVKLLLKSGVLDFISKFITSLNPLILLECLLKPFSYSGTLVVLTNMIKEKTSSYYILLGSMILFSTDTTFFVLGTYLSGVKKVNYSKLIKLCLLVNVFGILFSIIFSKLIAPYI